MTFDEVLEQVREFLQSKGRVAYRALKRRFALNDEYLEDLKAELIDAEHVARDEEGKVLVWIGRATGKETGKQRSGEAEKGSRESRVPRLELAHEVAERRQLTVMFCDLVGSTELSARLDPEELREVVRAYQRVSAEVVDRYEGRIAQYLGDGLLVYFGHPEAHEDDARRAVRTGLEIVEVIHELALPQTIRLPHPLQVRIGVHTGLVVVGEMGGGEKRELLAMGETPNIAARLQGLAEPDTVVMSAASHHLVHGFFTCHDLGAHTLKGLPTSISVYRVIEESGIQSRFDAAVRTGLTPLVGRDEELGVLLRYWEKAKEGAGRTVLMSGEAGIGKSRLVQELKDRVMQEGFMRIEFRCSPYYQNTAFYPVIDHLQRLLQFQRDDTPQEKLAKLEHMLKRYSLPLQEAAPLFAALLSLPHPEEYPPIQFTPQRQRQKTQEALAEWLLAEAERKATLAVWEDLQWADPSTLELHGVFMDRTATAPLPYRAHVSTRVYSVLGQPASCDSAYPGSFRARAGRNHGGTGGQRKTR